MAINVPTIPLGMGIKDIKRLAISANKSKPNKNSNIVILINI